MSSFDKLLEKFLRLDPNIRFAEVQKVLKGFGYRPSFPRKGSSHCTFRKENADPITIPTHYPIKKVYIKLIKDIIESENTK